MEVPVYFNPKPSISRSRARITTPFPIGTKLIRRVEHLQKYHKISSHSLILWAFFLTLKSSIVLKGCNFFCSLGSTTNSSAPR